MKLRTLSAKHKLDQQPVLVRVDWNIPLNGSLEAEHHLKLQRSKVLIGELVERGAKPIFLTHIGRPKKREAQFSTKRLVPIVKKAIGMNIVYLEGSVTKAKDLKAMQKQIQDAEPGTCFLLENVRFEKKETLNDKSLAKAYASLGGIFVNDAFASCHRKHTTVVGLASLMESYAGPALIDEVTNLSKLLKKTASPYLAILGGKKLTTKASIIKSLTKKVDTLCIGGAMAALFIKMHNHSIGASYYEAEALPIVKKLLKEKTILLPVDVIVTKKLSLQPRLRKVTIDQIEKDDIIVDIGPKTLREWHGHIQKAKTIVWNGPLGLSEVFSTGFGSRFIAKSIAKRSDAALSICGGGDTIPVIAQAKALSQIDFVSTGGGAMLEFLANNGDLPGLKQLR
ncbi:MAG TPA: phosphoglycerate kinase [bacterium]|nr:phosphoglycerate kinase [bacterium]